MSSKVNTAHTLDHQSAIDVLRTEYQRDALDVKSLLDSDKRGGLTQVLAVDFVHHMHVNSNDIIQIQ
jgi:hypothetical protein